MKTFLNFLVLTCCIICLSIINLQGQRTIPVINDGAAIGAGVDEATKNQILEVVQELMNKYYNIAGFWDEVNESFDEDKYTEFISIFSSSARVFDDTSDDPSNIDYSLYANNVYQYLQDDGVQFDLENCYLNSIDLDDSGFYVAVLDIDKIVYVGLDKNNFPIKLGDGKRYALNVRIDMPSYDVTEARIEFIKGEEAAKRVATPTYISGNFHYGLGGYIAGTPNAIGESFGDLTETSASVLGFQFLLRKALSAKENMWFHIGAGVQQHSLSTGFNNFDNASLTADQRSRAPFDGALMNGPMPSAYTTEDGAPLQGNLTINSINSAVEDLEILTIDVPIGITMRLNKTYSSRVFLDVSVVPSYNFMSSAISKGSPVGVEIPDSKHFPSIAAIEAQADGAERLSEYTFSGEQKQFTDNGITGAPKFGLGVQLSPTYQYDFDFRYGIEVGINLWYNVLSITESNNSSNGYLKEDYLTNKSFQTTTSLLEDYFSGVNPYYASLKVGFFYKLN